MSKINRLVKKLKYDLGLPFMTAATCCLCLSSNAFNEEFPAVGWLAVDGDTRIRVYICPECQPQAKAQEGPEEFKARFKRESDAMFSRVGTVIKSYTGKLPVKRYTFWQWKDGGPVRMDQAESKAGGDKNGVS